MRLKRTHARRSLISLVSMIDVLMILLIFFMVTSTYLNLDMVPMAESADQPAGAAPGGTAVLIRLAADGVAHVQGQPLDAAALTVLLKARLAVDPATPVIVLPSGAASTQALVAVMDVATQAGAAGLRILRLEARP